MIAVQYVVLAVKVKTKMIKMSAKNFRYIRFKGEKHRQMCAYVQLWTDEFTFVFIRGEVENRKGLISVGLRYSNEARIVRQYQGGRTGQEVNGCRHLGERQQLSVCLQTCCDNDSRVRSWRSA